MDKDDIQTEALKAIAPHRRCGVDSSMGSGKTMMGIRHMDKEYNDSCRFLIVGSKKSVFKAWKEDIEKFGMKHLIPHLKFTTYRSLHKQDFDYDVVYLDECHNLKFSHDPWLSNYQGKILGLTGTPPVRATSERGIMVNKYCPIVFVYKTDTAIDDGILNDYEIFVHLLHLNTARTLPMKKGDSVWYTSEQSSYDFWTDKIENGPPARAQMARIMRMKAMQGFPSKEKLGAMLFNGTNKKCLIFANTKEQAERLCKYSYHSTNPRSEDNLTFFKEGNIIKLSAVQQLSESVNIPNLEEGIILHAYGNERTASQKIGRFLRLNPKQKSTVRILCYLDTIDVEWVKSALEGFDQSKITYL